MNIRRRRWQGRCSGRIFLPGIFYRSMPRASAWSTTILLVEKTCSWFPLDRSRIRVSIFSSRTRVGRETMSPEARRSRSRRVTWSTPGYSGFRHKDEGSGPPRASAARQRSVKHARRRCLWTCSIASRCISYSHRSPNRCSPVSRHLTGKWRVSRPALRAPPPGFLPAARAVRLASRRRSMRFRTCSAGIKSLPLVAAQLFAQSIPSAIAASPYLTTRSRDGSREDDADHCRECRPV